MFLPLVWAVKTCNVCALSVTKEQGLHGKKKNNTKTKQKSKASLLICVLCWHLCPIYSEILEVMKQGGDLFFYVGLRDKDNT